MMNAPFQGFTPELLAQIAHAAFRPPQQMMGGGGMQTPGFQVPQGGDGGLGAGMAGLGMGLANWKPEGMSTDGRTTPEGTISPFSVGGGPMGPSGGAMAESPLLAASSGGGFWPWLKGLF